MGGTPMSRTPKRKSYGAVLRLAGAWKSYSYSRGEYDAHMERFRLYDEETAQAILRGAREGAKGAEKILYERFMKNMLPVEDSCKPFDANLDDTNPANFAFGLKLFNFCREELHAGPATCFSVLEGFSKYPLKEQRRLAADLPDCIGGIGFLIQEHMDWLQLFNHYGNLHLETVVLEFQDL
jgi:hypothetical protein